MEQEEPRRSLIISRGLWTGVNPYPDSACSPSFGDNAQCCLGHVMNLFLPSEWWNQAYDVVNMPFSASMPNHLVLILPEWMQGRGGKNIADYLAGINDAKDYKGGLPQKEANIAYAFWELGIDVTFVD